MAEVLFVLFVFTVIVGSVLHVGHRGARRRGERGLSVYWNSARGRPYVSVPLPFGFRLGHRA
jgi:hypothetical protein